MTDVLVDDLRGQIAAKQALVVVGAGVSVGASGEAPVASWKGLLHHGVSRAEAVGQGRLWADWGSVSRQQIDSGDLDSMLSAAESITAKLGGRTGGEYRRWLRESVGALTLKDRSVIDALIGLGAPVATTNYDGLLAAASDWPVVTWRAGARVQRVLRGDEQAVLHLHGHWEDPESVVLGIRSYEAVLGDASAQAWQQAMATLRSLLFVGAGLHDPNFGALRAWLRATFPGTEYRHFRLSLDADGAAVAATIDPGRADRGRRRRPGAAWVASAKRPDYQGSAPGDIADRLAAAFRERRAAHLPGDDPQPLGTLTRMARAAIGSARDRSRCPSGRRCRCLGALLH